MKMCANVPGYVQAPLRVRAETVITLPKSSAASDGEESRIHLHRDDIYSSSSS